MELKIEEIQAPAKISWNFEELKAEISAKVQHYEMLVYDEDQMRTAKKDRAALNKLKKALNDERIKQEREYMKSFNEFKAQVNELIKIIEKPITAIDTQIKAYEEKRKESEAVTSDSEKQWLSFSALLSIQDAEALKSLFLERNIQFKQI